MPANLRPLPLALFLALALALGFWGYPILTAPARSAQITAQIFLQNDCGITDDAFMVLVPATGKRSAFANRKATLIVTAGEPLQLITSPAYPKIRYDGTSTPAARQTVLNVQCDPANFENSINSPLRNQFGG